MTKKNQALTKKVERLEQLTRRLNDPKVSTDDKKGIVIELAHMGTDAANKVLSDYKKAHPNEPDEELEAFTELALEEGAFMAASDEDLTKKAVWDQYNDSLIRKYAELEERQCRIAEYKYELKVIAQLKKKAKTSEEKENWYYKEEGVKGCMYWDEDHKQRVENEIKEEEAILKEIESELPENLRDSNWRVGGCSADCCCEEDFDDEENF